jgi:hypothetical protein
MRRIGLAALGMALLIAAPASAQQGGFDPERMRREALAEPFKGVTTNGTPAKGVYDTGPTGVPTAAIVGAARSFLAALTPEQRERVAFPVDSDVWRNWANIHSFPREGVSLDEMDEAQREAAYNLLRTSLSARGYETSRDIMRLNHHLAELVGNFSDYGEHLYWFTLFGEPEPERPWGWQIEGHHLIVNYFVLGDRIVMTPTFMGSEPVSAESGKYAGTRVFEDEESLGLALMQALPEDQRQQAVIGPRSGRSSNLAEMFKDNITVPYEGLAAGEMAPALQHLLLDLVALYVGNMPDGHAGVKLAEVRRHLAETRFGWRGGMTAEDAYYYRIQSPVIFIEFDHQGPIALPGDRSKPTRRHVHTVVRSPNGGDYGRDLLRHHLETHHGGGKAN